LRRSGLRYLCLLPDRDADREWLRRPCRPAGTNVAYAWSSTNADAVSSSVTISPGPDGCGNRNGPWVVATLTGTTDPLPLLPCQSGFSYTLSVEVAQSATGEMASSSVTITVD